MQNLFHIEGKNFSGRSQWLQDFLEDGVFIGSEPINYLSGIVTTVEDEILLYQKRNEQLITYAFKKTFEFESMWKTPPTKLSGGEAAILSIFISLLLRKKRLHIDNTLEQLNTDWRNKLLKFIKDYFSEVFIFIADNRFNEYGIIVEEIKPKLLQKKLYPYVFNLPEFDVLDFSKDVNNNELLIKNLHFSYSKERHIFKALNMSFTKGIYHLKGINGAGKSTLSKLLVGIEKPSKGSFLWNNQKIYPYKYPGKYCTYTTQNPSDQISNSTVKSEILGASSYHKSRLNSILSTFGLQALVDKNPEELPFVIRKRINLASILYDNKDIIIFDEPTLGQDNNFVIGLAMLINRMRLSGKIIILISHSSFFISQLQNITTINLEKQY